MKKNQTILIGNTLSMHHYIRFYRMYVILKNASYIICTARYIAYIYMYDTTMPRRLILRGSLDRYCACTCVGVFVCVCNVRVIVADMN